MAAQLRAEHLFGTDLYVVAGLLAKLSAPSVEKWIEYAEERTEEVITGRNEWQVFRDWLKVCYKMAKRARLAAQVAPRNPVTTTSKIQPSSVHPTKSGIVCSRCWETGHK